VTKAKLTNLRAPSLTERPAGDAWAEPEIRQPPVGQLPWGHNVVLYHRKLGAYAVRPDRGGFDPDEAPDRGGFGPDRGGLDADEAPDRGGFGPDRGGSDPEARSSTWPKLQKKLEAAAAALEAARRAHRAGLA
jgi:hypothetical protein